ncbi:hypothetical protein CSUI_010592 [Cystoisospora suis]|uniref:Uncharacterized protein n=1 Tax=Cystoisospora suis TaxID=483139 RepID=A0A2C6KD82_9APIC|nr:hypothetical protein CSUI_010592 [Cystoisospora suis]
MKKLTQCSQKPGVHVVLPERAVSLLRISPPRGDRLPLRARGTFPPTAPVCGAAPCVSCCQFKHPERSTSWS